MDHHKSSQIECKLENYVCRIHHWHKARAAAHRSASLKYANLVLRDSVSRFHAFVLGVGDITKKSYHGYFLKYHDFTTIFCHVGLSSTAKLISLLKRRILSM